MFRWRFKTRTNQLTSFNFYTKIFTMKLLIKLISQGLKYWRYYQILKELSTVGLLVIMFWFLKIYGKSFGHWAVSETGLIYTVFLLVTIVLGLSIKMFYRMMVIKYYEKSTEIELFKFINEENN